MKISRLFPPLAFGLALLVVPSVEAQQRDEESPSPLRAEASEEPRAEQQREPESTQRERSRQREESQQDFSQRQRQRELSDREQPQAVWQLEPRGWIRIAVDYDGDGRYDAYEQIYAFDLERARTASRDRQARLSRRDREIAQPQQQFEARQRSAQDRPTLRERFREVFTGQERQQPQLTRLEGELRNVRSMQFTGVEGKEKLAHLVTDQGQTERVALGPEQQLERLDLEDGARVSIAGYRGEINDRPVIVAEQVAAGGDTVRINRQRPSEALRRFHGQVLQTRTTRLRDHDERFVIANVRLDDGPTMQVILGPQSKVRRLDLQEGDEIALLAQQARLNRQAALLAQQIAANEQVVRIDTPDQQRRQAQPQTRQREEHIQREQPEREREQPEREREQPEREREQPEREREQSEREREQPEREREQPEQERPEA